MDTEQHIALIRGTLVEKLDRLRPRPRIEVEESPACEGNIHVHVASRYFSGMPWHQREDLVWNVLTEALPWEVVQNVSQLHVWTDREFKQWLAATDGTEAPEVEPAAAS
jgi:stress-induced morphogen